MAPCSVYSVSAGVEAKALCMLEKHSTKHIPNPQVLHFHNQVSLGDYIQFIYLKQCLASLKLYVFLVILQ